MFITYYNILDIVWKRVLILFSLLFYSLFFSQKIVRKSDGKTFDTISIVSKDSVIKLTKDNLNKFSFEENDHVLLDNLLYDFVIIEDTLIIYDEVKEIETITIIPKKDPLNNNSFINNQIVATKLRGKKNIEGAYLQSIVLDVFNILNPEGLEHTTLQIYFYKEENGKPAITPFYEFEIPTKNALLKNGEVKKKWVINLPKIVALPKEDIYIGFFYTTKHNSFILLNVEKIDKMYTKTKQDKKWKKFKDYCYRIGVKMIIKNSIDEINFNE